jgi:uncharacterized protein YndB with AHSA1/START domain
VLKLLLFVFAALALLIVVMAAIGYLLPVGHVASREATLGGTPADVFSAITDVTRYAEWRPDVRSVEVLSSSPLRWREHGRNGTITFVVEESAPPSRLVGRIDDKSLAFGGTWTYEVAPAGANTVVRITERGEVYNPIFRFMSRFVFGQTATIDAYLAALRKRVEA